MLKKEQNLDWWGDWCGCGRGTALLLISGFYDLMLGENWLLTTFKIWWLVEGKMWESGGFFLSCLASCCYTWSWDSGPPFLDTTSELLHGSQVCPCGVVEDEQDLNFRGSKFVFQLCCVPAPGIVCSLHFPSPSEGIFSRCFLYAHPLLIWTLFMILGYLSSFYRRRLRSHEFQS